MKKIVTNLQKSILLAILILSSLPMNAVPAKPGLVRTIQLDDGSTISARLVGDEFGHYWMADNGKTYQEIASGRYVIIDGETIHQKADFRRRQVNAQREGRLANCRKVGDVGNYTGQKKGLIILVNFNDVSFQPENELALWKRIANEENFTYGKFKGSMYDYFYAQSDGKFELTFDVVGPVTVSQDQSYYGSNDSQGNDNYPATMVREACILANQYVNYADYDWDGDGYVDQVYVVYAGKGEADGGSSDTIWPHAWTLSSAGYYGDGAGILTLDEKKIDSYACGGELNGSTGEVAGIGTMCHEFSHCLGYPDFYDTDYSGGQGMGYWDLMDGGSYNGDAYQPAGYTSYERWMAGWKEPVELTDSKTIEGMGSLQEGGESFIIYNSGNSNEFYLLENRQKTGWDAGLPGAGLLIIHGDYDATAWNSNKPNDDPSHQRMTWIPADNQYQYAISQGTKYYTFAGMANDPFPYGSINSFGPNTTPAATLYNANANGVKKLDSSVEDITQNRDGTISFNFIGADHSGSAGIEGTIVFADLDLENGVQYSDPFDGGDFTVTFAGGANDGKYYNTGAGIRLYGNGQMIVAAKSGDLTQIKVTFAEGDSYRPNAADVVDTGTYDPATGVWTGSAPSVTFTRPSGSGHWRIQVVEATVEEEPVLVIDGTRGYDGVLAKGQDYILPGTDASWYAIPEFFTHKSGNVWTFQAYGQADYAYWIIADPEKKYIQVEHRQVDDDPESAFATWDINRALYINGSNNIGFPSYTSNPINWQGGADVAVPQIEPNIYQVTLVFGQQLNADEQVNFKFFKGKNWGGDFMPGTGNDNLLMEENPWLYIGGQDGASGEQGNIYSKSTASFGTGDKLIVNIDMNYSPGKVTVDYQGNTPDFPVAANIAAFKAMTDGTEATLTLNDAQVLFVGTFDVYVRDGSGAIDFYKTGIDFTVGQVMNGRIIGKSRKYNDIPELVKTDNTNNSGYSSSAGSTVARVVTIAEAKSETYYCDLIKIKGVSVVVKEEGQYTNIYAYIGNDSIQLYDRFQVGMGEFIETGTYDAEGILVPYRGKYEIYITKPLVNNGSELDVISFSDANVKSICVANWDTDGDEELSFDEAAAVTSLGTVFKKSQIASFDELQYFTGLTSIGKDAFNASTLTSVTLPKNITALEENAFLDCKSLVSISLPAKVQTIGLNALSGCTAMVDITVDGQNENLCSVDGVLFSKDKTVLIQYPAAKGTAYTVPEGTTTIARDAFYMSGLESILLPSTLTELVYDAFGYCKKLTDLTIPEGVTTIGEYILDHCTALKTLTIPGTVTSIGQRMANYCTAITDVYSYIQEPFGININCFSTTAYNNATLHVPYGTGTAYANATGWKDFGKIVIMEYTSSAYAVLSDDGKTLVFYADSKRGDKSGTIYNISDEAEQPEWFGQGSSVTNVVFDPSFANATPKSMYRWFYGMGNLSTFEGLEYLNTAEVTTLKEAFYGCGNLKQVDVSGFDIANATDLSSMFGGCSRLAWLDLSNFSLREGTITSSMLLNCSALKTMKLSESMSGIAAGACQGVGTSTNPCILFVPMGFSFGVNSSGIFQWKSGYFRVAEEPVVYSDNIDMFSGQTKALTIYLKNGAEEYNSFQFDLILPEGFSLETNTLGRVIYTLGDRYTGQVTVSSSKLDNHTYRVTAYMNTGDYITGEDGALITFNVKAGDLPMGTWTATLTNVFAGMTNNVSVKCEDRAFTLTIGAYYPGDTNHDGLINISDVTNVINYILGKNPSPFYQNEADVNTDGWINISDVTSIISIILGSAHNAVPANSRLSTLDYMYVGKTGNGYDFYLENHEPYSACEMTVQLPEGCVLGSVMLDERHSMGHKVVSRAVGDGLYRLVVYSTGNAPFVDDESPLLHLTTYGRLGDDIGISGILFVDGQNTCVSLPDVSGITTGISKIGVDTDATPSYNIQGIPVDSKTRGIHIEKNRKFMVK